jgi:glucose/arabinose dehydrogenase
MRRKRYISIILTVLLISSISLNVGLLKSSNQLNVESLKWAVMSQYIKYQDLKNGKIQLINHKNKGIEYSKFLNEDQNDSQKELIKAVGANFSIFGLAQGAGFVGLPKGLPKKVAKCASRLKLDKDLYFTDKGMFLDKSAYVFYQGEVVTNSLVGSLILEDSCRVEGKYRLQKSVTSWVLSEHLDSGLSPEQLPARLTQTASGSQLTVTRLGEICPIRERKAKKVTLECTQAVIDFSDSEKHTYFGVKSILLDNRDLYIAYAINNKKCNRLEIKKVILNQNLEAIVSTRIYYRSPGCFNRETTSLNGIGGRMIFSDATKSKIIFSLGNAEIWTGLETIKPQKEYGNILLLDLRTKKSKIISSGHRNPQGICVSGQSIYASEQGPDGGDELNQIKQNKNYGWPSESYGLAYGEFVSNAVKSRNFGSHDLYTKPLLSWVPALAVGDLICPNNAIKGAWAKNFLLATLKDNSIRRLVLDDGAIRVDERIPLGARVRDIYIDSQGKLIAITDNGSIISIKLIDR